MVTPAGHGEVMVVVVLCVAQFVVVLDATIVAITLPSVQADFGMSTAALGWVISAYTLTFGGCLLAAGRIADRVGRRVVFVAGLVVFGLASLACGLAPNEIALLAGRAAQGVGAALVSPSALALLTTARSTGQARARALGWWTAAAAGGGASGWDIGGAVLATGSLASFVLGLTLWPSQGLLARSTIASLGAAAVLAGAFACVEARAEDPLLTLALLRRPGVLEPNLVALVLTASTTPAMFFCTLYAQHVLGLSPLIAGLLFAPVNLAVIAGSLAGPPAAAAIGERRAMVAGLGAVAAGALALLGVTPGSLPLPLLLGGFVVMGSGLGVASVASTARGTAALAGADQGVASGLLSTSAQLGTVLGLAVLTPVSAARTAALGPGAAAQVAGYRLGFALAATVAALTAAAVALAYARSGKGARGPH